MNLQHIPFYIYWETYIEFITNNFPDLMLTDDAKFIGFIILYAAKRKDGLLCLMNIRKCCQ